MAPSRLLTAFGPLGQHSVTLLSTVDNLCRADRLAVVHGHNCVADDCPTTLPAGHWLMTALANWTS